MQQSSSDTALWVQFFKEADIPSKYAQNYAKKFTENRIRFEMLSDLDRPLLNELGITAIGDCLSILKHAKAISLKLSDRNIETEPSELQSKSKKNEVAKRIIESCITRSPSNSDSDSSEKSIPKKNNSNLTADVFSRLNFNPKKTQDDDMEATTARKRKLSDNDGEVRVLEYKGFMKSPEKTMIHLKDNNKRVLSLNENMKLTGTSLKRHISMDPIEIPSDEPKNIKYQIKNNINFSRTINGLKSNVSNNNINPKKSLDFKKFGSLKSDFVNKSVFNRIQTPNEINKNEPSTSRENLFKNRISRNDKNPIKNIESEDSEIKKNLFTITLNKNESNRKILPFSSNNKTSSVIKRQLSSVVRTVNQTDNKKIGINNWKKRDIKSRVQKSVFSRISM